MNPRGYSSRFADSSPPLRPNRDADRAEIGRQTEAYLAGGGKISSVSAGPIAPRRDPITNRGVDAAQRGAQVSARVRRGKAGNRGNARPA